MAAIGNSCVLIGRFLKIFSEIALPNKPNLGRKHLWKVFCIGRVTLSGNLIHNNIGRVTLSANLIHNNIGRVTLSGNLIHNNIGS